MTKERLPRRPINPQPSTRRGGGYDKGGLHDTPTSWLHGGDPTGKPGYVKGLQGKQKKTRKWPY